MFQELLMNQASPSSLGTAVVTGASSGLGKVYAQRLAARGYDLLLVARRSDRLEAISTDLQSRFPVRVHVLAVDLAEPDGLAKASERISTDDAITMLVNNAGTSSVEPVAQVSVETITNLIALNVTALTVLTKAVLANFIRRNAGTIINIGSVVSFTGFAWVPVYGGTKAYVQNFTQGLKLQLAETKIRLQYVAPAGTVSEIWDVIGVPMSSLGEGALMDTEACVDAALKGLDDGEFITTPSVHDETLLQKYVEASETLLAASQQPQPAPRYTSHS
jgi:short-subunit dehydrogenase